MSILGMCKGCKKGFYVRDSEAYDGFYCEQCVAIIDDAKEALMKELEEPISAMLLKLEEVEK